MNVKRGQEAIKKKEKEKKGRREDPLCEENWLPPLLLNNMNRVQQP